MWKFHFHGIVDVSLCSSCFAYIQCLYEFIFGTLCRFADNFFSSPAKKNIQIHIFLLIRRPITGPFYSTRSQTIIFRKKNTKNRWSNLATLKKFTFSSLFCTYTFMEWENCFVNDDENAIGRIISVDLFTVFIVPTRIDTHTHTALCVWFFVICPNTTQNVDAHLYALRLCWLFCFYFYSTFPFRQALHTHIRVYHVVYSLLCTLLVCRLSFENTTHTDRLLVYNMFQFVFPFILSQHPRIKTHRFSTNISIFGG